MPQSCPGPAPRGRAARRACQALQTLTFSATPQLRGRRGGGAESRTFATGGQHSPEPAPTPHPPLPWGGRRLALNGRHPPTHPPPTHTRPPPPLPPHSDHRVPVGPGLAGGGSPCARSPSSPADYRAHALVDRDRRANIAAWPAPAPHPPTYGAGGPGGPGWGVCGGGGGLDNSFLSLSFWSSAQRRSLPSLPARICCSQPRQDRQRRLIPRFPADPSRPVDLSAPRSPGACPLVSEDTGRAAGGAGRLVQLHRGLLAFRRHRVGRWRSQVPSPGRRPQGARHTRAGQADSEAVKWPRPRPRRTSSHDFKVPATQARTPGVSATSS